MLFEKVRLVLNAETDDLGELLQVLDIDQKNFFRGADFTGSDLRNIDFIDCDLTGARFEGAVLDASTQLSYQFQHSLVLHSELENTNSSNEPVKVFFSYSKKDLSIRDDIDEHLGALKHIGLIDVWWDREINPGEPWDDEINLKINESEIILMLVSASYLNSEYCYHTEMVKTIERESRGEVGLIWILARNCYWDSAPFARLQGLPRDKENRLVAIADVSRRKRDAIYAQIARAVGTLAHKTLRDRYVTQD